MNASLIVKDSHPRKSFHNINHIGLKALNLGVTHQAAIEERLPGVIDALALDLDRLGVAIPGAIQKRSHSVAVTAEQRARILQGYTRVQAIRSMVRTAGVPKTVQQAYGVGWDIVPTQYKCVVAALQSIVKRATDAPEEAAALGLGPAAIADLTGFLASLNSMAEKKDKTRTDAPLSTKERNMAANRVLQTVALIAGAGMLLYPHDPATFASFQALIRRPRRRSSASKKGAPAEAPKPADAPPAEPPKSTSATSTEVPASAP
jgi:hypothetical protein